ncbi:MAG: rhodanese-like domain-containing protein [SAR202 cluster bacterium]|nr:rhodanese-like domain-containing protein [SAR202 cluster bacterium]|tara:strand:+ start:30 stop:383 length:354 start_codon:yes stop_codon:yes gene_type:complete
MVKNNPGEPYSRISSEEAFEMQKSGNSTVVDVRNQDEYEAGHVKGAIWIPVDEIVQRFNELPEDGNLMFICAVGARSGLAAEYASSLGVDSERLFNIEDGTPTWIDKGLPSSIGTEK